MIRATSAQKEAVLAYIKACHALQRAEIAHHDTEELLRRASDNRQELWMEVKRAHAPGGVYLFEGTDAVVVSAEVDYPNLVTAIL